MRKNSYPAIRTLGNQGSGDQYVNEDYLHLTSKINKLKRACASKASDNDKPNDKHN